MDRNIPFRNVERFRQPFRLRSTNFCEGWNNAWNIRTRRTSTKIWLAIKFLKNQQKKHRKANFHMRQGTLARPQKRKLRLHK